MAMMTKRPSAASQSNSARAFKMASAKPASGKVASTKVRSAKVSPKKASAAKTAAAAHILSPAKGPRTISHRKIREAVEKVFRERSHARG